jgi:hypothetical protein
VSERYRAVPVESYPLGFGKDLIKVLSTGQTLPLPAVSRLRMDLCRNFQSLPEHVAYICKTLKLPDHESQRVAEDLKDLIRKSLLLAEDDFYAQIQPNHRKRRPISSIAIVTANRVEPCMHALRSFADNVLEHSRTVTFRLMDDSLSPDMQSRYRHELERRSPEPGLNVRYAGRREKEAYLSRLAQLGIEPETARFALLGENDDGLGTFGANRNCVLMDTVGECVLNIDDDVVCRSTLHPRDSNQLRICGHLFPRDMWFFRERQEVLHHLPWSSVDILQEHEKLLGAPVGDLILKYRTNSTIELEDTCNHILMGVLRGDAVISITIGGVAGDSGGNSSKFLLNCLGQTKINLLSSRSVYDTAMSSREVLAVAKGYTISHLPFCHTLNIGLDNCDVLPPFFPVARGEDMTFGLTAMHCFSSCFLGHLPVALLHNTESGRTYDDIPKFRMTQLITFLISSYNVPPGTDRAEALRLTGRFLQELATAPDKEFWGQTSGFAMSAVANWMRGWNMLLNMFDDYPPHWRKDLQDYHGGWAALLDNSLFCIPVEYRERYPLHVAKNKTREIIKKAGKLLCAWPEMLAAAQYLKSNSVQVSTEIEGLRAAS